MTDSMQAVTYDAFGDVDQLRVTTRPVPVVGPGEVLIKVHRAAVNPVDWKVLAGGLVGLMPHVFPIIPGWDVAGEVTQVGPDTPEFGVGDAVLAYARKDWVQGGTFAEYVTMSVRGVAAKPAGLDWDVAAALPLAGGTALRMIDRLGVGSDDTVLVHAAAGGVGSFAAQLARLRGARVIGTASPGNHAHLTDLGIEPVAYGDGLVDRIRALAPQGVTVVADTVGGVLDVTQRVLTADGRHNSIVDGGAVAAGGEVVWVRPDAAQTGELARLAAVGDLRVNIAARFGLDEVGRAFELSRQGHTRGKIVITVA